MKSPRVIGQDNHLFDLARLGQLRLPKNVSSGTERAIVRFIYPAMVIVFGLSWPVLVFLIMIPFIAFVFLIGVEPAVILSSVQDFTAAWLIVLFLPIYLFVWLWLWLFEKRHLWTVGYEGKGAIKKYGRGLLVGFLLFCSVMLLLVILNAVELSSINRSSWSPLSLMAAILIFAGWMVQGGGEETVTRGFLLPILGIRFGSTVGIIVSSLIFMILHLLNPGLNILAVLNLLLFSVFAAVYAMAEGGLWGISALHGMWNWAQGSLFGLQVSGLENQGRSLFRFQETGPDWLTGGEFGPEGGLVITLVFSASIVVLIFLNQRNGKAS